MDQRQRRALLFWLVVPFVLTLPPLASSCVGGFATTGCRIGSYFATAFLFLFLVAGVLVASLGPSRRQRRAFEAQLTALQRLTDAPPDPPASDPPLTPWVPETLPGATVHVRRFYALLMSGAVGLTLFWTVTTYLGAPYLIQFLAWVTLVFAVWFGARAGLTGPSASAAKPG